MAISSFKRSRIRAGLNKYDSMLAGNAQFVDTAFEQIGSTVDLSTNAANITFSFSADQQASYKHLHIRIAMREAMANTYAQVAFRFNGDSGANYSLHYMTTGATMQAGASASQTWASFDGFQGDSSVSGNFGVGVFEILDAFSSTKNKTIRGISGRTGGDMRVNFGSGAWFNTSAISSITILGGYGGNLVAGTSLKIYGIRG